MKQPNLGKKISELRLAKGLTQSELAEKCNLSLRTIQRIECAEVSTRSYSVKLIFKNPDYEVYNSTDEDSDEIDGKTSSFKINTIRKVVILSIFICAIILTFFKLQSSNEGQSIAKMTKIITASQMKIKRWMNTGQVDSVLTLYREYA